MATERRRRRSIQEITGVPAKRAKLVETLWNGVSVIERAIQAAKDDATLDQALVNVSDARAILDDAESRVRRALKRLR